MWICSVAAGKCRKSRDAKHGIVGMLTSGKVPLEKTLMRWPTSASGMHGGVVYYGQSGEGDTYIRRHVFPQAPSPTMTSLRRISAMLYRCTRQQDWPAKRYSSIYCAYGSVQRVQDWRGR